MDYAGKQSRTQGGPATTRAPAAAPGKRTLVEAAYPPAVQRRTAAGGRASQEATARSSAADGGAMPAPAPVGGRDGDWIQRVFGIHASSATSTGDVAAVQHRAGGAANERVHAAAARGIEVPPVTLPFADQIQASFGPRHDVASIQAHIGGTAAGAASAMGASAYATGNHAVFASAPDLHTAAHEAAHVVQQRAGVQLKGGVGEAGDAYERHADAVADRVVRGQSAEDLLDDRPAGPTNPTGIQRKITTQDGSPVPEPQVQQLIRRFMESKSTAIASKCNISPEQVEKALAVITAADGLGVKVGPEECNNASEESTLSALEAEVVRVLELHGSVSAELNTLRNTRLSGQDSQAATIPEELLEKLHILAHSEDVKATVKQDQERFKHGTSVAMVHRVDFDTSDDDARYVRFVKASRLLKGKIAVTMGTYLTFGAETDADQEAVENVRRDNPSSLEKLKAQVRAALGKAQWSFDGPREELSKQKDGKRTSIDRPGLTFSDQEMFPYILITEFIGVLFDPKSRRVLNVTPYEDELVEDGRALPAQRPVNPSRNNDRNDNNDKGARTYEDAQSQGKSMSAMPHNRRRSST